MPTPPNPTPNYTITYADAQTRINRWKMDQVMIKNALINSPIPLPDPNLLASPVLGINAFTFKLQDLCQLFERIYQYNNPEEVFELNLAASSIENPINAVRFYVGEKNPDPIACLIGVGVTDFLAPYVGGFDVFDLPEMSPAAVDETSIYDFSYPCPSTCANPGGLGEIKNL